MRPEYESEVDRSRERLVIDRYCQSYGLTAVKLAKAYQLDFALLKAPRVLGFAEVKWRERQYATLLLSLHKWAAMRRLADVGERVRLVVRWPTGVWSLPVEAGARYPVVLGGREDRDDWQDIEPMVEVPVGQFRKEFDLSELEAVVDSCAGSPEG